MENKNWMSAKGLKIGVAFCFLFIAILCGCDGGKNTSESCAQTMPETVQVSDSHINETTTPFPTTKESLFIEESAASTKPLVSTADLSPMEAYEAVIKNEAGIFSIFTKEFLTLDTWYEEWSKEINCPVEFMEFAVVDMDVDDVTEIIIRIKIGTNTTYGGLILHYEDGIIYGYDYWYRMIQELKADGTFSYSGGSGGSGYARFNFNQNPIMVISDCLIPFTYQESMIDSSGNHMGFEHYVNYEAVSEDAYSNARMNQDRKTDVVWHDFTNRNFEIFVFA